MRAEHALGAPAGDDPAGDVRRDVRRDTDVDDHQGIYDAASARQAMTRLALSYWRARRLCAGVEALGTAMRQNDPDGTTGTTVWIRPASRSRRWARCGA
jgi:hypothetical protein